MISTPPTLAGLFCLASAEGAGLLFFPAAIQPHTSVYRAFCTVNATYTSNDTKQCAGLCRRFSCDFTRSTANDTRQTQADIIPPAPRWSVSQRRNTSSVYQVPQPRRNAVQGMAASYYNKVYKGAAVRPCRGSMPARRGQRFHLYRVSPAASRCFPRPAGQSSSRGAAGGAGPLAACRRISFRAFAR